MSKLILKTPMITVNSVDLSNRIDQVTLDLAHADVDTTAFGASVKEHTPGLGDYKISLSFQEDFAAAEVEATLNALIGTTTTVTVQAVSGATSTVNPVFVLTCAVLDWKPIDGKVGDLSKASVTWPINSYTRSVT